jgi:hypothetical protein
MTVPNKPGPLVRICGFEGEARRHHVQADRALHSLILAARMTFALAGALVLVPAAARAQHGYAAKPVPYGLGATIKIDGAQGAILPAERLDTKPFSNPYISGIGLQIHWSDIQPVKGQPNWSRLDELFALAQSSHKWVHLYVFCGFFSPAWALEGAETDQFAVPYGPYNGKFMTLPMPWDPVYLGNYFAFLKQLSERYGDRPEFLMVAATGPTSVSEEFTEPNNASSDLGKWIKHGYTSTKLLSAWQQTFQIHAKLFPNQYVSLSMGHVVPINAEGVYDRSAIERTGEQIVGQAWSTLGAQFGLQSSSLQGTGHYASVHEYVRSFNGRAVTGFLLSTSCEKDPRIMGAAGSPPLALERTILNGMKLNDIGKHCDYIEIYSDDVDADDLQPVLRWGASLFE